MNKQQLAAKIWEQANAMRSKIEAHEYKDYILGFIFYKYLSDKETKFLEQNDFTKTDIQNLTETVKFIQSKIGYFIAYKNLFSTWLNIGSDFSIANVRDSLLTFSRLISDAHKKVFTGVFDTLRTGLSKLGESAQSQTKAANQLIQLIDEIPMDGKQDYDVLGFIYEYLIGMFAANAGKKAGEFYTPHEVATLMAEIVAHHVKDTAEIKIYDPTSGSGSLLINIGKSIAKHRNKDKIKYYAQELKENTYNLTRMNLVMRDIIPENIVTRNADTLEQDWPFFEENDPINSYNPLYIDAVVSNPPYSQKWDSTNKESDPRYAPFGLAPKTKADFAFLLHDLYHVKPDGIMTIVLPHGVLFRGGEEGKIRENLIENNHIDTIIGLPANIFFGTGIPTIIMVLKQRRDNNDILILDASKDFIKEGKNNKLQASHIKKIVDTVVNRKTIPKYATLVNKETIRQNDYNLNIPRYVDSYNDTETYDMYASMFGGIPLTEIDTLTEYWAAFPTLKNSLFTKINTNYVQIKEQDIKTTILQNADVTAFTTNVTNAFKDFDIFLQKELIQNMLTLHIEQQQEIVCTNIFNRIAKIPLLDKYKAYQILDDAWNIISADLEMIQTEGLVKDIIPLEIVQQTYLKKEADALQTNESRLLEIQAELQEIVENLTEEEKETNTIDDEDTATKSKSLVKEEKELKTTIKNDTYDLLIKTKDTLKNLTDDQVRTLLQKKWIDPLVCAMNDMPLQHITTLVSNIQTLTAKYQTTYESLKTEIVQTEKELCTLLDQLTADEFDLKGIHEFKTLLQKT